VLLHEVSALRLAFTRAEQKPALYRKQLAALCGLLE